MSRSRRAVGPRWLAAATLTASLAGCSACQSDVLSDVTRRLEASPTEVTFAATHIGASATARLTFDNTGTGRLLISEVELVGDSAFGLEIDGGEALEPAAQLVATVEFAPVAVGAASAELVVSSNADDAPTLTVSIFGEGIAAPSCDDENPCTADSFNAATGACVFVPRVGPCDDASACTENDSCHGGSCRGAAISCPPASACALAVCEPLDGCVSIPDPTACDDQDPCTSDHCDPVGGCFWEAAPDGTSCGESRDCTSAHLCFAGTCSELPGFDGLPCDDNDICTRGDACDNGVCTGVRVQGPAAILGTARTFGTGATWVWGGTFEVMADGRLLFADSIADQSTRFTVVEASSGRLQVVAELVDDDFVTRSPLTRVGERLFAVCVDHYGWLELVTVEVTADDTIALRGRATLNSDTTFGNVCDFAAPGGGVFYVMHHAADSTPVLRAADTSGSGALLPHPGLNVTAELVGHQTALRGVLVADPSRQRLLVGVLEGLWELDVSEPLAPVDAGMALSGVAPYAMGTDGETLVFYPDASELLDSNHAFQVRDLETLELLGSIAVPYHSHTRGRVVFTAHGLVIGLQGHADWGGNPTPDQLRLHDLTDPTNPALIAQEVLVAAYPTVLRGRGSTAVVATNGGASVRRIVGDGEPDFVTLSGPGHGLLERVATVGGDTLVFDRFSVHRLERTQPDAPAFVAGGRLSAVGDIVSFGGAGQPPTYFMLGFPSYGTPFGQLGHWQDLADPDHPVPIGSGTPADWWFDFHFDGWSLIAAAPSWPTSILIAYWDLGSVEAGQEVVWEPTVEFEIPCLVVDATDSRFRIATDSATGRIAVAARSDSQAEVIVATLGPPPGYASSVVAIGSVEPQLVDLAVAGDIVVVLTDADESAAPARLAVYAAVDSWLAPFSGIDLPGAESILAFAGTTVFVATDTGLLFVDVAPPSPVISGSIATLGSPRDLAVEGGVVTVVASKAVHVVAPPCP